jgi:type IV secretion system protein VirB2
VNQPAPSIPSIPGRLPASCDALRVSGLFSIGLVLFGACQAWAYGGLGSGGTPMADVLCEIVNWFSGNLGRGLATIGISAVSVGAVFGKVSWGLALTVVVGVAVMFGATELLINIGIISAGVC